MLYDTCLIAFLDYSSLSENDQIFFFRLTNGFVYVVHMYSQQMGVKPLKTKYTVQVWFHVFVSYTPYMCEESGSDNFWAHGYVSFKLLTK